MKKIISALLVAALVGLTACSEDTGSSSPAESSRAESSSEVATPTPEPTEEPTPTPEPTSTPEPEGAHGLIIMASNGISSIIIYSVDPDTGETKEISSFQNLGKVWTNRETGEESEITLYEMPSDIPYSALISEDCTKFVAIKCIRASGECHAGWVDSDGIFFDVTDALGQGGTSDFSTDSYYPCGFIDGNRFMYGHGNERFSVPVSKEITSNDIQKEPDRLKLDTDEQITQWVSDTEYLINIDTLNGKPRYQNLLYDTEAEKYYTYLPDAERPYWNGVVSPDGTRRAFMSSQFSDSAESFLYTKYCTSESEPSRVDCDLDFIWYSRYGRFPCVQPGGYTNMLIDWK